MPTLAERQLAAWEQIARDWPLSLDAEGVGRCACGKGVLVWIDRHAKPYRYSHEQVLSLTVLHLRNHHPDLDPDKPAQTL